MLYALSVLILIAPVAAAQPVCPGTATLTVFVENLSAAAMLVVALDGELAPDAATCVGTSATSYQQTMTCTGSGIVRCGQVTKLRPGAWVHRLAVSVPDSAPQRQAQRLVLVAGNPRETSNALVWTVYPRTFVVSTTSSDGSDGSLRAQLGAADAYTHDNPGPALVIFSPPAFPGVVELFRGACEPEPSRAAGICFSGSHVVVDGLDENGIPSVTWKVSSRDLSVLRIYGSENVFRGIVFAGTEDTSVTNQLDTVAITGPEAWGNRIEQSVVRGPTFGDAVSVDNGAGKPRENGPIPDDRAGANLILRSEITGAADRGVKINDGVATIAGTCLHDNHDGGLLSTEGGRATAMENIVQHNPGTKNGLTVLGTDEKASRLTTQGNIVRFNGPRGVSVGNNARASLNDDYVANNYIRGSVVETKSDVPKDPNTNADLAPTARFHGVAIVCNGQTNAQHHGAVTFAAPCTQCSPSCDCVTDTACLESNNCLPSPGDPCGAPIACYRQGPDAAYGDAAQPGLNAFTANRVDNFRVEGITRTVEAEGNEWEHCPAGGPCLDVVQDISPPDAPVDTGLIVDPRTVLDLHLDHVSPPRPRAGEVVRVYGGIFNAIGGNPSAKDCVLNGLPACVADSDCRTGPCVSGTCPCSITNPAVEQANRETNANRIRIKTKDGQVLQTLYPDVVTPTMLAFHMSPFDCFAPLVLEVAKPDPSVPGRRVAATTMLCDPTGCQGKAASSPCDDGNVCTVDDRCDSNGNCVGTALLVCDGPCLTCDPVAGCVPMPASVRCDDGDACTTGDHCSGDANACVGGRAVACAGQCLTGMCDGQHGCVPKPSFAACEDGNSCTEGDHCSGTGDVCVAGNLVVCAGPCLTGVCDPRARCLPKGGVKALTCRVDECRRVRLHRKLRKLAFLIDEAVDAGKSPKAHRMSRLTKLLTRCGVAATP